MVNTVSDILDAIRTLPRPERVRLVQELSKELGTDGDVQGRARSGGATAAEFRTWLADLLTRVPVSPALASEAFDRGQIYDE
jgi:hypothetical protein